MLKGNVCALHPHLAGVRYNGGNCPECTKATKREYRIKNAEKIRAGMRAYRGANKERMKEQNANWRANNKERIRENNLRRTCFSAALFDTMLAQQEFKCAICGVDLMSIPRKQVHADHCHRTNTPRGILCHHCNSGLGCFGDDQRRLQRAVTYLNTHTRIVR